MQFIDGDRVNSICDFRSLVAFLEESHRQPKPVLEDMLLRDRVKVKPTRSLTVLPGSRVSGWD